MHIVIFHWIQRSSSDRIALLAESGSWLAASIPIHWK